MKTRYTAPGLCFTMLDSRDVILASGTDTPGGTTTEQATGIGINQKDVGTLPEIPFDAPEVK